MTISSYEMTREDLERHAANAMHSTLDFLQVRNLIDSDTVQQIKGAYSPMVLVKESLLEKLAKVVFPERERIPGQAVIKIVIVQMTEESK